MENPNRLDRSSLIRVRERLKAEIARRAESRSNIFAPYVDDPIGFVEMGLLGFVWSKQKEILLSVRDNRRTAVPSCHDVGKSRIAAYIAAAWLSTHAPGDAFVVTLAPTARQVRAILWREINRIHSEGRLPGETFQTEWKMAIGDKQELVAFGVSPKDTDPTSLQGIHAKYVLVIFDEACGIGKQLWDAADSLIANEYSRMLAIGNPDSPSTEFETVCKPGSGWNVIPISAFESPNFTGEEIPEWLKPLLVSRLWVDEKKKKWGEDSPIYRSKVLGKFPEEAPDGLIPLRTITEAVNRELTAGPSDPNELGVDVARYGRNHTVIFHRHGPVARRKARFNGRDLMTVTGHVVKALRETGATRVKVDDGGLGGGVTDRLQELKRDAQGDDKLFWAAIEIVPVNSGEAPTIKPDKDLKDQKHLETERYFNLRAQINWGMRERFIAGDIDIEADEDLESQAGDIKYRLTSRGQLQIESKDEMEKRGRESPDDWDALVLAYAEVGDRDMDIWARLGRAA